MKTFIVKKYTKNNQTTYQLIVIVMVIENKGTVIYDKNLHLHYYIKLKLMRQKIAFS